MSAKFERPMDRLKVGDHLLYPNGVIRKVEGIRVDPEDGMRMFLLVTCDEGECLRKCADDLIEDGAEIAHDSQEVRP